MACLARIRQRIRLAAVAFALAFWTISPAAGADHVAKNDAGVAIRGYDTVAYFVEGEATRGNPEFEYIWNGARWWFVNAEHRQLFAGDPERYAPRFGGYCTGGLSLGYKIVADPENWYIADGALHMHHTREGRERALANLSPLLSKAEETWARLRNN